MGEKLTKAVDALRRIERMCPATQEMTVAHMMAQEATDTLEALGFCGYCDGTGDVHSIDGEWRGRCSCPAGRAALSDKGMGARTIYLSGPITGMPEKNHPLFMSVAGQLREMGHRVYNPREFTWEGAFPKRKAFAEYCAFICNEADTIVLLPGWDRSLGCSAEVALAKNCSLEIIEWAEWDAALNRLPEDVCS